MANNSFPSSTLFHYPILLLLADGNVHSTKELIAYEIKKLSISSADQEELTPGGEKRRGINKVASWTHFAITDLKQAEFIVRYENGYIITETGKTFFQQHINGFVAKELIASKAYRKYKNKGEFAKPRKGQKVSSIVSEPIPEPAPDKAKDPVENTKTLEDGVVYILTNPAFKTFYVKIGYTINIHDRLKELYNTSVPLPFKIYALMKTKKFKQAEKMIHAAFKSSRIGDDREFFMLKPEEALEQMKVVAEGLEAIVIQYDEKGNEKKTIDYSK